MRGREEGGRGREEGDGGGERGERKRREGKGIVIEKGMGKRHGMDSQRIRVEWITKNNDKEERR